MRPVVGRIVHFFGDVDEKNQPVPWAAIITKISGHEIANSNRPVEAQFEVSLKCFFEQGDFVVSNAPFSKTPKKGHWTWPSNR